MEHGKHLYLMIGLAVVAGLLFSTDVVGGSVFVFAWVAGCMAMMFFMMRGMGTGGHGGHAADAKDKDSAGHQH